MMGIIEKAGGLIGDEMNAAATERAASPVARTESFSPPPSFKIDEAALAERGFYTQAARDSRLALELRAIKRRLLRRLRAKQAGPRRAGDGGGRARNLVLVASARAGEGKTFCAVNLALSLAFEEKTNVALVDADLPRPKLRAAFDLASGPGFGDLLGEAPPPVEAVMRKADGAPLWLMSEGGPRADAADRLAGPEGRRLFAALSRRADGIVVIDAPPVLATRDAVALARHVDEIIFVVEADATPQAAAAAALDELLDVNPNVSLVLNRCLIAGGASYYESYEDYERAGARPLIDEAASATDKGNSA